MWSDNFSLNIATSWFFDYIHYEMWHEITYQFQNFYGATVEVYQWISNCLSHFTGHVISYPCWNLCWSMLVKGASGVVQIALLLTLLKTGDCQNWPRSLHRRAISYSSASTILGTLLQQPSKPLKANRLNQAALTMNHQHDKARNEKACWRAIVVSTQFFQS